MLGELVVKISADMNNFNNALKNVGQKLDNASKSFSNAGKTLSAGLTAPIVGITGALIAGASKLGDYSDRILDLEAITGMTTDSIQKWQYVTKIAGTDTEAITNAVQKLNRQMAGLENGTGVASEALAKLNLNFDDFNKLKSDERMDVLIKKLAGVESAEERARIGTELFGLTWSQVAPIVALGAEEIEKAGNEAEGMGKVLGKDALNQANNFRIGIEKLKAQMTALGVGIITQIMPALTNVMIPFIQDKAIPLIKDFFDRITFLIESFKNLSPQLQKIIIGGVALLASLGPILIVIGKLISIISILNSALLFLSANPIVLVIAGLVALAGYLTYLYKTNEDVANKLKNIWELISSFFNNFTSKISTVAIEKFTLIKEIIQNAFTNIKEFLIIVINEILAFFMPKIEMLVTFWNENGSQLLEAFKNIFNFIFEIVKNVVSNIVAVIEFFMPTIKDVFITAWEFIKDITDSLLQIILGLFKVFIGIFTGDWRKGWEGVKDIFVGVFRSIESIFKGIINGIITGINTALNLVKKVDLFGIADKIKPITLIGESNIGINPLTSRDDATMPIGRTGDFTRATNIYLDGKKVNSILAPQLVDTIQARIGSAY